MAQITSILSSFIVRWAEICAYFLKSFCFCYMQESICYMQETNIKAS